MIEEPESIGRLEQRLLKRARTSANSLLGHAVTVMNEAERQDSFFKKLKLIRHALGYFVAVTELIRVINEIRMEVEERPEFKRMRKVHRDWGNHF